MAADERFDLEPSRGEFRPIPDRRPLVPEPLPVRLVAIDDVHLPASAQSEPELDAFYARLLLFEREPSAPGAIVYRADNFRLRFDLLAPPIQRQDVRPVGIEVPSLADTEHKLVGSEIEFTRQRGLVSGDDNLLLQDPAGNWIALAEMKRIL